MTILGGLPKNDPRDIATGPGNTLWVTLDMSNKVARITGVDPPPVMTPPDPLPPLPVPVVTPPPPVVPLDSTAPVISRLRLTPKHFRAESSAVARISAAKRPAKITLTLSEPATVTFSAGAAAVGVKVSGRCVAPTAKRRPTPKTGCEL